ncbi:MAG: 4'-phosphopantetheinyl transferase superfamily protein [Armatimonas sp.]
MNEKEIQVYQLDLDTLPVEAALLSFDERERAARFRFESDRHRYMSCRAALRQILAAELNICPESLVFTYNPHGKPALGKNDSLYFNVAHSGTMALIALTYCAEIGVDIEALRPELATAEVAATVFTEAEREQFVESEWVPQFFRLWTRKEAYLKAIGEGFASPSLEIPSDYQIEELSVVDGYRAALAISGATCCKVYVSWYPDRR